MNHGSVHGSVLDNDLLEHVGLHSAQWAMIWTKPPLKPKSTNAFGYCRTSFGRYRMTWNLSLAPFRALKMPKKGLKTTKKCLFGYSEASYVTQIHFFLQYASSYVSWKCIRCKIHHIGALNHPRSPLGTFWTLKTAHFGPLEQLTSFKVFFIK